MAATDATPIPVKNQAYRVTFPILDADGDLVSGAAGLDSEISKDGGTFVDCTNEATEIATGSGIYFLDITATEMNADTVAVIVKTSTSGAKTTPMVFYPNKAGALSVNVTAWAGTATATTNVALKNTLAKTTDITGFNDISQANVQSELTTYGALKPTTAGRTLDIATTGEAGLDFTNVLGTPPDSAGVTTLLARITSTLFSGITSLAQWLGAMAGKQVGNATARTEIRATGAGSGGFDETTDSNEALRDNTGTAGAGLTALPAMTLTAGERTSIAAAIWNALTSGLTTAGSIGKLLVDNVNATISSRAVPGDAMALTSGERTTLTAAIWNALTSGLTTIGSIGKLLVDNVNATIGSRATQTSVDAVKGIADKVDAMIEYTDHYRYTAGALEMGPSGGGGGSDPWGTALPGAYAAGTAGNILGTRLDLAVSSRAAPGAAMTLTAPYDAAKNASSQASVDAVKAKTDQLNFTSGDVKATLDGETVVVGTNNDKTGYSLTAAYDAAKNAASQASVDAIGSTTVAIKGKTDQLTFGPNGVNADITLDAADLNGMADAILKRDMSAVSGEAARSLLNAIRFLRNKWDVAGTTLTVRKEDDTAVAWTGVVTTNPVAEPITGNDPA